MIGLDLFKVKLLKMSIYFFYVLTNECNEGPIHPAIDMVEGFPSSIKKYGCRDTFPYISIAFG
jgi:hypothetical protein